MAASEVKLGMQPRGSHKGGIMSAETLLIILFVGLVAGWLAGQIVQGTGFGLVADIAIGIVGALIGSWLLPALGLARGSSQPSSAPLWVQCCFC